MILTTPNRYSRGTKRTRVVSNLSHTRTIDSSSEDYRSVIDDLTVENQKLKRILKRYQKSQQTQAQGDKLFEVRIHGLPPAKKRKLEQTLQEFTSTLNDTEQPVTTFTQYKTPALVSYLSSNSASHSRAHDSAYASASADASTSQSNAKLSRRTDQSQNRNQNVKSYLQTISRGLLPKYSPIISERARMQLVVRRLERLFTGKITGGFGISQPQQQQEISQSAANAERHEQEANGYNVPAEGQREAKIIPTTSNRFPAGLRTCNLDTTSGDTHSRSDGSSDQRPTRPLDLDPSRAQTPFDNIQYMKHLGFGSPKMDPNKTFEEGEGWVYLNLLINLAQLHIFNVTTDFVRAAILKFSNRFELSQDGQSIRWKGGKSPTQLSIKSGSSTHQSTNGSAYRYEPLEDIFETGQSKQSTAGQSVNEKPSNESWRQDHTEIPASRINKFLNTQLAIGHYSPYVPIYHHLKPSERSSDASVENSPLSNSEHEQTEISHTQSLSSKTFQNFISKQADEGESGQIIYYTNAGFCTDLTKGIGDTDADYIDIGASQASIIGHGIGSVSSVHEPKGLLSLDLTDALENLSDFSEVFHGPLHGFEPFAIKQSPTSIDTCLQPELKVVPLQASGVGGVQPDDNFTIDVSVQHSGGCVPVQSEIVNAKMLVFPPASLPSPSYAFPSLSSSSNDESDSEADDSSEEADSRSIISNIVLPILQSAPSSESAESATSVFYNEHVESTCFRRSENTTSASRP